MEIILIRGTKDAGKTTTSALLYKELIKISKEEHYFNSKEVEKNSLIQTKNKNYEDFIAIIKVNGKIIVIISAGDYVWALMDEIELIIKSVTNLYNAEIDYLICCGKTHNRSGSAYNRILEEYPESKLHEFFVFRDLSKNAEELKTNTVKEILNIIK
ncbi:MULTISPECIES: hypothetical protein [Chryseobacterium]|uniref:hypothetical protein n=1 Tax=Chryseobacterium TaxID=59732 RepID=UPI000C9E9271|nr:MULTISPECIES: hypothetical protein [Chryseobacterium]VXC54996.1 conserved hypothetical protein [Chryseobacterium sp. 8AT]